MYHTLINPFRTIGSPVTHVNWPMNWPNVAAWPALPGWPAHSRHTVACMHRFSHILGLPPEPAVWFMSEWRAVAIDQARKYEDLPIIFSSFELATVRKRVKCTLTQSLRHCECCKAYVLWNKCVFNIVLLDHDCGGSCVQRLQTWNWYADEREAYEVDPWAHEWCGQISFCSRSESN